MTRPRSIFVHIYAGAMLVLLTAAAAMYGMGSHWMRSFYVKNLKDDIAARCAVAGGPMMVMLKENRLAEFIKIAQATAATGPRVTVIRNDGKVIFDSESDPKKMENHSTRPEISEAIKNGVGSRIRYSTTVKRNLLYVARAFSPPFGDKPWLVRLALSMQTIEDEIARLRHYLTLTVLLIAGFGALIAAAVSRKISLPLVRIARAADRFGRGDLSERVEAGSTRETEAVSMAMNTMAENLTARINDLKLQHDKLDTLFANMGEGVLIIEKNGIIRQANPAAASFIERDGEDLSGRSILEAVRNTRLRDISRQTLAGKGRVEGTVDIHASDGERSLQVVGSLIEDPGENGPLAVLVIRDVTSLLRLEGMRREFVANVSHELKTPVTAIIGAVETIIDDHNMASNSRKRFLAMIHRHAIRLKDLVEDILSLSRLESMEIGREEMRKVPVREIIDAAISLSAPVMKERNCRVKTGNIAGITVMADRDMMVRAVANLIDNAARYGVGNATVTVTAVEKSGRVNISVRNQGEGIAAKDIERIFERFYRAERSRNRESGGTGLGLAIVKHIVEQHRGRVAAESSPGRGSTFTIDIPEG